MFINLKGNKVVITCTYSVKTLAALKSITGRVWNVKAKHWEVPIENISEAFATLEPLGFTGTLEAKRALANDKEKVEYIEGLKNPSISAVYNGALPLRDFQKHGAVYLRGMLSALLGDAPGLGKSIQTIAALEGIDGPHLIFVPNSLKFSWADEIEKWNAGSSIVLAGNKELRATQWNLGRGRRFVIANYELLLHDLEAIKQVPWASITCDEANRISNAIAKTTKALKSILVPRRIALTGTPISNSPVDIFSIIDWIAPNYLGNLFQFKAQYCITDSFGSVVGYKNLDILQKKIERFMLRRTKEEVLKDFPAKTYEPIIFELSEQEQETYERVKNLLIEELKVLTIDKSTLGIVPVKMLRLKQLTDHPSLISEQGYSTKLKVLEEMLEPILASGDKAIIFTQFAEMAKILHGKLSKYKPLAIHGEVDPEARQERVRVFQTVPEHKLMIMTEAGAYGLNLQAASYIFHYDLPWSVAKMQQREDRAHRYGQTKAVTVYSLNAKGTIDEYVAKVLHKKNKASVAILDDVDRLEKAGISEEDIREILRL